MIGYRERFARTLAHEQVDRPPLDLAGTALTAMHPMAATGLAEYLGFSGAPTGRYTKFDERVLKYFDVDFRRVGDILAPEGGLAEVVSPTERIDVWGVRRIYTGRHWDIVGHPLRGATREDLRKFPWPDPERISPDLIDKFKKEAQYLFYETDYVVCAEHPVYGILELGCWMCGYDDFLMRLVIDRAFVTEFFEMVLAYQKKVIDIYYGAIGPYIHFTSSGDDFGMQSGPMISPKVFRELIAPYFAERIRHTKKYTKAAYLHHTCGSVVQLIPTLIDIGVDILNPIQPQAAGMEPDMLKRQFGDKLCFHGGVDTQQLLRSGEPEEVEAAVSRLIETLGANGGYILAPAHNIQEDVPPENIVAMYEAGVNAQPRNV